jgi:hypothetical protein
MTITDFLGLFPRRRQNSPTDWHVPCPGHDDNAEDPAKFSLHVTVVGDHILINCFAGCAKAHVLAVMKLPISALFIESSGASAPREASMPEPTPTLEAFASLKQIKQSVLEEDAGWRNHDDGLAIPYQQRDGSLWRWRYRTSMRPGAGFKWDGQKERALIPYGRHRLDQVMEKGELWLVEGESDAVTAWARGLPCLGIPGNMAVKALEVVDLAGIETLWIVLEPGQSGIGFATKLQERLAALRYQGTALLVKLPAKDLSDLHVLMRAEFWTALREAQRFARDLATWTPALDAPDAPQPFAETGDVFLARTFPPVEVYVEGVLSAEGSGFIGGEEKLGKTYYALTEFFSLAMGVTLCGRFAVPQRRRVLLIEEEDSPRRTNLRRKAIARGHGYDPDDPAFLADFGQWSRVSVWQGFTLDDPAWLARLDAELAAFPARVIYLDVLRKITTAELNKAVEASPILNALDERRRRTGCLFRLLHHYRKNQGQRMGRGSQEMGGSYVLAAWAEQSVFLEPIGRKGGGTSFDIQQKDGAGMPTLRLRWEVEGPAHDPTRVRLHLDEIKPHQAAAEALAEQVLVLLQTLPAEPSPAGPGVSIPSLVAALKGVRGASEKGVRSALRILIEKGVCTANDSRSTKGRRYTCTAPGDEPLPRTGPSQENLV